MRFNDVCNNFASINRIEFSSEMMPQCISCVCCANYAKWMQLNIFFLSISKLQRSKRMRRHHIPWPQNEFLNSKFRWWCRIGPFAVCFINQLNNYILIGQTHSGQCGGSSTQHSHKFTLILVRKQNESTKMQLQSEGGNVIGRWWNGRRRNKVCDAFNGFI